MKLIVVADLHIDSRKWTKWIGNKPLLWDYTRKIWMDSVQTAIDEKVDALVVAGDIFNSGRPWAEPIRTVIDGIILAQESNLRVIFISGNHEKHNWPKGHRHVYSLFEEFPNVEVALTPKNIPVGDGVISALPYLSIPEIRDLYQPESLTELQEMLTAEISNQMVTLASAVPEGTKKVLIGHGSVMGASYGSERDISPEGPFAKEAMISLPIVEEEFDYGIFGHIHKHQMLGKNSCYVGSTYQIDFSEEGEKKGILLFDTETTSSPFTLLETPSRNLLTVRLNGSTDLSHLPESSQVRLLVEHGHSALIDATIEELENNGHVVVDKRFEGRPKVSLTQSSSDGVSLAEADPRKIFDAYLKNVAKDQNLDSDLLVSAAHRLWEQITIP